MRTTAVVIKQHFNAGVNPDDTVIEYITTIINDGTVDDILEAIPPMIVNANWEKDEGSAKQKVVTLLKQLKLIPENYTEHNGVEVLKNPVRMAELEKSPSPPVQSNDSLKHGNTYEVVNIEAKPVDQPDYCLSLEQFMEETFSENPITRKAALRDLCPCHVKHDVEQFWKRIMEMTKDPDPNVRYQVLHNLCDGSPLAREEEIIAAIEGMHNDEDKYIRRRVHQVLSNYRRTGKWNIL